MANSFSITLQSDDFGPEPGYRPAVNGCGIGPYLDQKSAQFLVDWLNLSRSDFLKAETILKIEITLLEALFRGKQARLEDATQPLAIESTQPLAIEAGQ